MKDRWIDIRGRKKSGKLIHSFDWTNDNEMEKQEHLSPEKVFDI